MQFSPKTNFMSFLARTNFIFFLQKSKVDVAVLAQNKLDELLAMNSSQDTGVLSTFSYRGMQELTIWR
jgi:hypothetical protein